MPALLFVLYVIVEIAALFAVGHLLGAVAAIALLIASSAVGMLMIGVQGRRVFEQFRRVARGQLDPGIAVADGALVAVGGFLMFIPGLVTGLFGLLLLLPPTRAPLRPVVTALAARRIAKFTVARPYRGIVIDGDDVVDGVVVRQWYDDGRGDARRAIGPA
ncbi:FxsA family protein [Nocardia arizonensis]|uniref:FxsA family protein n=1 Tax=Nocardia arizonensis TaxID=1141647 RepID=UPI0006D11055|nr:FxsA family protein [Nocardia arizonensis]